MIESMAHSKLGALEFETVSSLTRQGLMAILLATSAYPATAQAQSIPSPPVQQSIDANGVDVALGTFNVTSVDLQIGPTTEQGLSYIRENRGSGWRDNMVATISSSGSGVFVSFGGVSDSFTVSGSGYTSNLGNGATLTFGSVYTYTSADGIVAVFNPTNNGKYSNYSSNLGYISYIQYPNGNRVTFTNRLKSYCTVDYDPGQYCPTEKLGIAIRLTSVQNSFGYQLYFTYKSNTLSMQGEFFDWTLLNKVTGLNNAVEVCTGDTCSPVNPWPTSTYTRSVDGTELSVTPLAR